MNNLELHLLVTTDMSETYIGKILVDNSNGTTDTTSPKIPIILSLQLLWGIYGSMLLIFGVPGNLLVICVLQREVFRGVVSTFLKAVAIVNMIILTLGVPNHWINFVLGHNILLISYWFCFCHRWIVSFCHSSANWLLVSVTAVRLFYLKSSVRSYSLFTLTKARAMIVLIVITLSISEYVMLHLRNIGDNKARTTKSGKLLTCTIDFRTREAWIRHSIVSFLPCFFLIILTIWLIKEGQKEIGTVSRRSFVERSSTNPAKLDLILFLSNVIYVIGVSLAYNFTRMLMLTNVQFLVTNVPASLYYSTAAKPVDETMISGKNQHAIATSLLSALLYTGFAVNVIVYCFSGKRFPSEMKELVVSLFHKQKLNELIYEDTPTETNIFTVSGTVLAPSKTLSSSQMICSPKRLSSSTEV